MSQVASWPVANGAGAEVRAVFNARIAALLSANSGTSAPANAVPGMLWLDTTNHILKIRNEANTNWVPLLEMLGAAALTQALRVDAAQSLTSGQKTQGRDNLGLAALATKSKAAIADLDTSGTASGTTFLRGDGAWGGVLGLGQTWQDVKSSRSAGVSYQNTTGRPIQVAITVENEPSVLRQFEISANGSTWVEVGASPAVGGNAPRNTICAIVPNGHYYRWKDSGAVNIRAWAELR